MHMSNAPDCLNPAMPAGLRRVRMPVVAATNAALAGYVPPKGQTLFGADSLDRRV